MTLRQKVSGITTAGDGLGVGDWLDEEDDEDGSIEDEDDDDGLTEEDEADTESDAEVTELLAS